MIFFKKEKEVIKMISDYLDEVEKCMKTAEESVQSYLTATVKEAKHLARQVRQMETQADVIRYSIRDKLYLGAYMPLVREDIYKLVESIDKVANAAEACCDFFLNQRPQIPVELKSQFSTVSQEALEIIIPLKKAVLCFLSGECPLEEARQYTQQVGLMESDVDKREWDLTKAIFISSMDYSHKIHLRLCLDTIVEVSDRAEDAADQLELTFLKKMI